MTEIMNTLPERERRVPASASNDAPSERNAGLGLAAPHAQQLAKHENVVPLSLQESDRAVLRPIVATMDSAIASLQEQLDTSGYATASSVLVARWRNLVEVMALGAPPKLRACPHCGYRINALATRCIECWKTSDPAQRV